LPEAVRLLRLQAQRGKEAGGYAAAAAGAMVMDGGEGHICFFGGEKINLPLFLL